jgi:hypothetical protein
MNDSKQKTEYQTIGKKHWGSYFDLVSKMARGKWMQLEVVGKDLGDQIPKDWILFEGVSYDPSKDVLYIHTQALEHAVSHPRDVIVFENGALKSINIKDAEGGIQIIHFRDLIQLTDFKNAQAEH